MNSCLNLSGDYGSVSRAAIAVVAEGSIAGVCVSSGLASFVFKHAEGSKLTEFGD